MSRSADDLENARTRTLTDVVPPLPAQTLQDLAGSLAPGSRLGDRYVVDRLVGKGGMGAVYLAIDDVLGKEVALKLVAKRNAGSLRRLRDEVLRAQEVTHRNVCRTYDLEEVEGHRLVKMEYIDGQTLAEKVAAGGPLSIAKARAIGHQIANGLAAAHERGVVHSDLKPQNVMVENDSHRVVLMDFGLARLTDLARQTAERGGGTPEYMAPEQVRGREVDGRADLYALGCVLYYMLTGQVVFPAETATAASLRHVKDPPPDLRAARPDIPAWLARLILRLLEKDPARRPADAAQVAVALAGSPKRRRLAAMLAAVGVMAFATAAIGIAARRAPLERPKRLSDLKQHQLTFDGRASSVGLSPDGRTLAYVSQNHLRLLDIDEHRVRELDAENPLYARWLPDSSALELAMRDGSGMRAPRAGGPTVSDPVFSPGIYSPDGSELATVIGARKNIEIRRGYNVDRTLPVSGIYDFLQLNDWSPDGRWLLIATVRGGTRTLWTLSADGRERTRLFEEINPGYPNVGSIFTPRGDGVLIGSQTLSLGETDLMLLPVVNGAAAGEIRSLVEGLNGIRFSFSRDGSKAAYTRSRGPTRLWRLTIDRLASPHPDVHAQRLLEDTAEKRSPAISFDGKRIAYIARGGKSMDVFIEPIEGGLPRRFLTEADWCSTAWAPDGNQLALIKASGSSFSLWIASVVDGRARQLSSIPSSCDLQWTPQSMIAFKPARNNYTLIDPQTGEEQPLDIVHQGGRVFNPVWSQDGAWVALYGHTHRGSGLLVMSADRHVARVIAGWGRYGELLAWSANGDWIYARGSEPASKTIFRIPSSGGEAQPWFSLPIDEDVTKCDMSQDTRQMVCASGGESDVWMIDDFDQLLPRRR